MSESEKRDETRCFATSPRGARCYHDQIPGEDYCGGHTKNPKVFNIRAYREGLKQHFPDVFKVQPVLKPLIRLG